LILNSIISS